MLPGCGCTVSATSLVPGPPGATGLAVSPLSAPRPQACIALGESEEQGQARSHSSLWSAADAQLIQPGMHGIALRFTVE